MPFFALQTAETVRIKTVEITPQLDWIGMNIEETVDLQKEHERVYKKIKVDHHHYYYYLFISMFSTFMLIC